jgi:hypothetical protein
MGTRNWLVLCIVAGLCSAPGPYFNGPSAHAEEAPGQATSPQEPPSPSKTRLLSEAAEIGEQVARIRGLELKGDIKKGVKERDELRDLLIEKLDEGVSQQQIDAEASVFERLGLFPAGMDYKQLMLDMLTEQIAGFYDQSTGELYIMEGLPEDLQRPTIAHEIFHAIQDQHFDIGKMLAPFSSQENADFALARMALIEGDATVVMIDFTLYEAGVLPQQGLTSIIDIPLLAAMLTELDLTAMAAQPQLLPRVPGASEAEGSLPALADSALGKAPAIIQELLMFPYIAGLNFVIMARSGRTWQDVDAIYAQGPVSTEQILHPERYFAGDWPVHITFDPSAALPGYEKIYDTVLGEFQLRSLLSHHLRPADEDGAPSEVDFVAASTGWGGDRLLGWRSEDGNTLLTHLSSWDTIDDAVEFFEALVAMTRARYPDSRIVPSQGQHGQSICVELNVNGRAERLYVERWGDLVLYVEGAPSRLDGAGKETDPTIWWIRDRVWKTFSKTSFERVLEARKARLAAEEPSRP